MIGFPLRKQTAVSGEKFYLYQAVMKIPGAVRFKNYRVYIKIAVSLPPEKTGVYQRCPEKIFKSFDSIRIFTKEPGKEKSPKPVIIKPNSTVGDIAEKILKGFSKKIKQTKIWGPSSKFAGQSVGLKHKLKDLDVVEFRTN